MKKLILTPLLFITLICSATNYYVKNGGSDSNTGLSDDLAWATLSKIASSSFSGGDTIFFKCDSKWDEYLIFPSSGSSGSPIVLTSYSTGEKPLFTAASADTITWTNLGDGRYRNTYYDFLHDEYSLFFEDNIHYPMATSSDCSDGIWYTTWGGNWIWYRPTSGGPGDHDINYSKILWSTHHAYTPSIELSNRSYITIDNLQFVTGGFAICMWNDDAVNSKGITISNCYFEMAIRSIFLLQGTAGIDDVTICNNHFYRCMNAISGYCTDQTSADNGYEGSDDGYLNNWNIYGNEIEEIGITDDDGTSWGSGDREGIGVQNMTNSLIHDNYIHGGCQTPMIFWDRSGCASDFNKIYNNLIYNTTDAGSMQGVSFQGESGLVGREGNEFYCNILINCGIVASFDIVEGTNTGTANLNKLYNNVFYGDNRPIRIMNTFSESGYWEIKNNIFYGNFDPFIIQMNGTPSELYIDNNLYYNPSGSYLFSYDDISRSFATWQGLGFDANTILSNPQFKGFNSYKKASDFDLKSTSPAIRMGTDMGLESDYFGHKIKHNPPDIGAIEYKSFRYLK